MLSCAAAGRHDERLAARAPPRRALPVLSPPMAMAHALEHSQGGGRQWGSLLEGAGLGALLVCPAAGMGGRRK